MSKIKYRKVYRKVPLSDYFEDSETDFFEVWVNPHRGLIKLWTDLRRENVLLLEKLKQLAKLEDDEVTEAVEKDKEELERAFETIPPRTYEWYSSVIKFGGDHSTPEDIAELARESEETDPNLWTWIMVRVWEEINGFRDKRKKG